MPDNIQKEVTLAELKKDISHLTSEISALKNTVTNTLEHHEHRIHALELQAADQHDIYIDKQLSVLQQSRENCLRRFETIDQKFDEAVETSELLKMELRISTQIDELKTDMLACNKTFADRVTKLEDKVGTHSVWIYILSGAFMITLGAAINFGFKLIERLGPVP